MYADPEDFEPGGPGPRGRQRAAALAFLLLIIAMCAFIALAMTRGSL